MLQQNDHWKDAKQDQPDGILPILKEFAEQYLTKEFESLDDLVEQLQAIKSEGGVVVEGTYGFNYEYSKAISLDFVSKALADMERYIPLIMQMCSFWLIFMIVQESQCVYRASPISLKLTFEQLKRAQGKSLRDCIKMEYRMTKNFGVLPNDFYEGVRAKLIDKDDHPRWKYTHFTQVAQRERRLRIHSKHDQTLQGHFIQGYLIIWFS